MKKISIFKLQGQEVLWALSLTPNGAMYAQMYQVILNVRASSDNSVRAKLVNLVMKVVDVCAVRLHLADCLGYEIEVPVFWEGASA